jgi:hypothetical protein
MLSVRDNNIGILPKTGQVTSYADYDDGYYQHGWNRKKNRFQLITRAGGVQTILDFATGLEWRAADESGTYTWANALAQASIQNNAILGGFSDWKLPNRNELLLIADVIISSAIYLWSSSGNLSTAFCLDLRQGIFEALSQTSRSWQEGMTALNSDVYASVYGGGIYKQVNGTGNFETLSQTSRLWRGMTTLGNNVYACVYGGDIYKQTNGTGNFEALSQTSRNWAGMTTLGNNVYACDYGGDIYKQTNGTGNFEALSQTSRNWRGMTTLGNNVYACVYGGDIYKQVNGTGNFEALSQTSRNWHGMTALNSDVYACVYGGDIYKQVNGTGNFEALSQTSRNWAGMTALNSDVYACVNSGDIYKQLPVLMLSLEKTNLCSVRLCRRFNNV